MEGQNKIELNRLQSEVDKFSVPGSDNDGRCSSLGLDSRFCMWAALILPFLLAFYLRLNELQRVLHEG